MYHTDLTYEKWTSLSLAEQMANIGSEIERALKWKEKNNLAFAITANSRALELYWFTLNDHRHKTGLREIARSKELWLDFFLGDNIYHQTSDQWRKYFRAFNYLAQNSKNNNSNS